METQQQSRIAYRLKCEKRLYLPSVIGLGIIPANAGSLNSWQSRLWYTESSPGMQGTQTQLNDGTFVVGIIPADARSTDLGARYSRRIQDHPRGCGEHCLTRPIWPDNVRIIPTDAGNTRGPLPPRSWTPDHPRGCGEHITFRTVTRPVRGSSPRMRGTPLTVMVCSPSPRIIPADAGNTQMGGPVGDD